MTIGTPIVHIVDDDASWRTSTRRLMTAAGYRVTLHESAEAFLEAKHPDAPGCILLDLRMSGLNGLQLQQRLGEVRHKLPIVFISGHGDISTSVLAIKAGAEDFLTKPVATEVLLDAVARAVARNRADRDKRGQVDAMRARVDALTPTERKVFALIVRGKINKQIAAELDSAERTIKWHRSHIMQKLQCQSLAEMVLIAERLGLVGPDDRPHSKAD